MEAIRVSMAFIIVPVSVIRGFTIGVLILCCLSMFLIAVFGFRLYQHHKQPLTTLSAEQIQKKLKWWMYNDIEYRSNLEKMAKIFVDRSFNGNKVITTGTGGAILTKNKVFAKKILYLAEQAKDDSIRYIHNEVFANSGLSLRVTLAGHPSLVRLRPTCLTPCHGPC